MTKGRGGTSRGKDNPHIPFTLGMDERITYGLGHLMLAIDDRAIYV